MWLRPLKLYLEWKPFLSMRFRVILPYLERNLQRHLVQGPGSFFYTACGSGLCYHNLIGILVTINVIQGSCSIIFRIAK